MSLRAVAYVSQAVDGIAGTDIDRILQDATAHNRIAGVTGVLVFDGHRFVQYLEGPEDGVDSAYGRVLNAGTHHLLRELARGEVPTRHFPRWTMASSRIAPEVMADIADAPWDGFIADGHRQTGFARLLGIWTGTSGELEPAALSLGS